MQSYMSIKQRSVKIEGSDQPAHLHIHNLNIWTYILEKSIDPDKRVSKYYIFLISTKIYVVGTH